MARSLLRSLSSAVSLAWTIGFALPAIADHTLVCGAPGNQHSPRLVSDGANGAIIVWMDHRHAGKDLYAQRINATSVPQWTSDGIVVSDRGFTVDAPSVAEDGAGGIIVAWTDEKNDWDSLFVRRLSPTGTPVWSRLADPTARTPQDPHVVSDGYGGGFVFWYQDDVTLANEIYFGNMPYGSATPLSGGLGDQYRLTVIPSGSGGAYVSWRDQHTGYDIPWVQRFGTPAWPPTPVTTMDASSDSNEPTTLVESIWDGVLVAWARADHYNQDLRFQRAGAGGAEWGPNGMSLCDAPGSQGGLVSAADGAGGALFAWVDQRSGSPKLYAQRSDAAGNLQWTPNGNPLCTSCVVSDLSMASDGAGGAIVTWVDSKGADRDIYAQRIMASGATAWGPDGIAISAAPGNEEGPQIVADASGGAIIVWTDRRTGTESNIYARHVDGSGAEPVLAVASRPGESGRLTVTPNPLRGTAQLALDLPEAGRVEIVVRDVTGRVVARVAEREFAAGLATLSWDGRSATGNRLPSGIYFASAHASRFRATERIVVID